LEEVGRNMTRADQELLTSLKTGAPLAVQTWFKTYHQRLLRIVKTRIGSDKDAEEVTQEIFINCLKHLPLFRGESSIWTWMQGIARHEIADYYRKRYAKKAIRALPLSELLVGEEIHDAHETAEFVRHICQQLTNDNRELLFMKYVDGKKVRDIARELGRTAKAVESDLFRARQEFKRLYAQEYG
jgi:RNA polymerase sigma-70 factor, ECF subfamily